MKIYNFKISVTIRLFAVALLLLTACTKQPDWTPTHIVMGEGFAKNYYNDSNVPNLKLQIAESVQQSINNHEEYGLVNRGFIIVDSVGHFSFETKTYNAKPILCANNGNEKYKQYGYTLSPQNGFSTTDTTHYNIIVRPRGVLSIRYNNWDRDKFDSISIQYPYNPSVTFSWPFYTSFGRPLVFYIEPARNYKLEWSYIKNYKRIKGKDIYFTQPALDDTTHITVSF